MFYVTMNDTFMSYWGESENKINKLIFVCESREQAERLADKATSRDEMKYIRIYEYMPEFNLARYYVQIKTRESSERWYTDEPFYS